MKSTKVYVKAAVIAALYAVLTLAFIPISYGPVQFRLSEILTILPIFTRYAIPGLTVGCIIANLIGGYGIYDIVFGSLATLLGALGTYYFRKKTALAMLFPVISNACIVGSMLFFIVPDSPALLYNVLTVGIGEFAVCFILGLPTIPLLKKYPHLFS